VRRDSLKHSFFFPLAQLNRVPPWTGAYLLIIAPKKPAIPAATNEARVKQKHRSAKLPMILEVAAILDEDEHDHGDRDRSKPGDVLFPLLPSECQPIVVGLDISKRCGNIERSAVPGGGAARYHG